MNLMIRHRFLRLPSDAVSRCSAAALIALLMFGAGCANIRPAVLRDIQRLPQDLTHYLEGESSERELISQERHGEMLQNFRSAFLQPWRKPSPEHAARAFAAELARCRTHPGYGENGRLHTLRWVEELAANARLESFPNLGHAGVTLVPTNLRTLPTHHPRFESFNDEISAYPFDTLQNSFLPPGTPIFVWHKAGDGAWFLVESSYGMGWVPSRDIARLTDRQVRIWEETEWVALIRDGVPVYSDQGLFLFHGGVGAVFPLTGENEESFRVLAACGREDGTASLSAISIDRSVSVRMPHRVTQTNIARVGNELMGKPYGWGGIYQNRDCSAMLKDLFTPFGIWLPRHSSHQALYAGRSLHLHQMSPAEREKEIIRLGIPFATLIWSKGHVMLYLGRHKQDEVLVFHMFWGIRTRNALNREGRHVVGHSAVTTLHPGIELPDIELPGGDLLHQVRGMTLLLESPHAGQGARE